MPGQFGGRFSEALRALVDRVEVYADRVELVGELTALLRASGAVADAKGPSASFAEGLVRVCSVEGDAGTRNRRSQYVTTSI